MKILSIILLFIINNTAHGQLQDYHYLNYSDNEALWIKLRKIKEKRSFDVKVNENGDSTFILTNLTGYDIEGDIINEREFYNSDTTKYDETQNKYADNKIIETVSIMKDPYDDVKTVYEYHDDKLIRICDYSRITSEDNYNLDSCTNFIYRSGKLVSVKSKERTESYFKTRGDSTLKYDYNHRLTSKYFKGKKISQYFDDSRVLYEYNKENELTKITSIDRTGNILKITDFVWSGRLLMLERTTDVKQNKSEFTIHKYQHRAK